MSPSFLRLPTAAPDGAHHWRGDLLLLMPPLCPPWCPHTALAPVTAGRGPVPHCPQDTCHLILHHSVTPCQSPLRGGGLGGMRERGRGPQRCWCPHSLCHPCLPWHIVEVLAQWETHRHASLVCVCSRADRGSYTGFLMWAGLDKIWKKILPSSSLIISDNTSNLRLKPFMAVVSPPAHRHWTLDHFSPQDHTSGLSRHWSGPDGSRNSATSEPEPERPPVWPVSSKD